MKSKILILIAAFAVFATSCTQITPKEEGFKVSNSGDYRGIDSLPLLTGWQWYFPSQTYIVTVPNVMQHVVWSEDDREGSEPNQHVTVSCMGGSGFKMDVGVNYHLITGKGSKVWLKYKTGDLDYITTTILRNIVRGAMGDASGVITPDSLLNSLPVYEAVVRKDLTKRFEAEGFVLDNFNVLSMPRPVDENLAKAINNKIIAKQNAETSKQQLEQSIAEAAKKAAEARGDSARVVISANAEAEAIRIKQREITTNYIDYIRATRWNGIYPTTMLGSGSNTLFNLK